MPLLLDGLDVGEDHIPCAVLPPDRSREEAAAQVCRQLVVVMPDKLGPMGDDEHPPSRARARDQGVGDSRPNQGLARPAGGQHYRASGLGLVEARECQIDSALLVTSKFEGHSTSST